MPQGIYDGQGGYGAQAYRPRGLGRPGMGQTGQPQGRAYGFYGQRPPNPWMGNAPHDNPYQSAINPAPAPRPLPPTPVNDVSPVPKPVEAVSPRPIPPPLPVTAGNTTGYGLPAPAQGPTSYGGQDYSGNPYGGGQGPYNYPRPIGPRPGPRPLPPVRW